MSAQLVQEVDEGIYRMFRSRCNDQNIDLGRAVTDALDVWLEHFDYDDAFIECQRKILCEEEFVSLDEIQDIDWSYRPTTLQPLASK